MMLLMTSLEVLKEYNLIEVEGLIIIPILNIFGKEKKLEEDLNTHLIEMLNYLAF